MNFNDLKTLAYNGQMDVAGKDVFLNLGTSNSKLTVEDAKRGTLVKTAVPLKLAFVKGDGGATGVWIPYVAQANVYGYLQPGDTWVASGPYSGCYFEIGVHDGKLYAAHLSREGKTDPNIAAWGSALSGKRVLFSKKIGVFAPTNIRTGTAGITIAAVNTASQSVTSVTRLDVVSMNGGMVGRIMGVSELKSE